MKETKVASRYARSLIMLAQKEGKLEEVRSDMLLVDHAVDGTYELELLLKSPVVKGDKKSKVIDAIFNGKVGDMVMSFMQILIKKGREGLIHDVAEEVERQYLAENEIQKVEIVSAVALTEDQRKSILDSLSHLEAKTLTLDERIDPNIIGGLIVKVGDRQIDNSVLGRLQEYRSRFNTNYYEPAF